MIVDIGDGIAYAVCLREGGTAGKLQEAVETTDEKLPSQSGGKGIVSGKKAERFRQVCAQGGVGAKQPGQDEEGRAEFVRGRLIQAQEGLCTGDIQLEPDHTADAFGEIARAVQLAGPDDENIVAAETVEMALRLIDLESAEKKDHFQTARMGMGDQRTIGAGGRTDAEDRKGPETGLGGRQDFGAGESSKRNRSYTAS